MLTPLRQRYICKVCLSSQPVIYCRVPSRGYWTILELLLEIIVDDIEGVRA